MVGSRSPAQWVALLAGVWSVRALWSDGAEATIEATFAGRGKNLIWERFPNPQSGVAPHDCDTRGSFDLDLTLRLLDRGVSEAVTVHFSSSENLGNNWQVNGRSFDNVRCASEAICGAQFTLSSIDEIGRAHV